MSIKRYFMKGDFAHDPKTPLRITFTKGQEIFPNYRDNGFHYVEPFEDSAITFGVPADLVVVEEWVKVQHAGALWWLPKQHWEDWSKDIRVVDFDQIATKIEDDVLTTSFGLMTG